MSERNDKLLTWPPGPWDDEPRELSFWLGSARSEDGYRASLRRHDVMGHLCGYLDVPLEHPWATAESMFDLGDVDVHGGVTFVGHTEAGDRFRVGFDCAHAGDLIPLTEGINAAAKAALRVSGDVYRPVSYVVAQLHHLARQADEAYA